MNCDLLTMRMIVTGHTILVTYTMTTWPAVNVAVMYWDFINGSNNYLHSKYTWTNITDTAGICYFLILLSGSFVLLHNPISHLLLSEHYSDSCYKHYRNYYKFSLNSSYLAGKMDIL